ncbi:hypothetical protein ABB27_01900 [Stenotrophomonas terrae]|uniref:Uncharacterized protein n=1 Tax=Stenotrophomonas terrae TaxID=405446 RepID=A0A0R0CQ90_9GAMM|nr:hypothetical protein ABB27_01900 [Stenotrophomonas terrae]
MTLPSSLWLKTKTCVVDVGRVSPALQAVAAADVRDRLQERAFAPVFDETLALQRMGRRAEPLNCVAAID